MAEVAREVVVLAESDKLGRKIHNLELPWSMVDVLVTDSGLALDAKPLLNNRVCGLLPPQFNYFLRGLFYVWHSRRRQ